MHAGPPDPLLLLLLPALELLLPPTLLLVSTTELLFTLEVPLLVLMTPLLLEPITTMPLVEPPVEATELPLLALDDPPDPPENEDPPPPEPDVAPDEEPTTPDEPPAVRCWQRLSMHHCPEGHSSSVVQAWRSSKGSSVGRGHAASAATRPITQPSWNTAGFTRQAGSMAKLRRQFAPWALPHSCAEIPA